MAACRACAHTCVMCEWRVVCAPVGICQRLSRCHIYLRLRIGVWVGLVVAQMGLEEAGRDWRSAESSLGQVCV